MQLFNRYDYFPPFLCFFFFSITLTEYCNYGFLLLSLLLRRECCSFSNGEYVKAGLAELEQWCYAATEEVNISSGSVISWCSLLNIPFMQYAGSAWDELKHIRQAVGFLVC